jgi:hypothetical protein
MRHNAELSERLSLHRMSGGVLREPESADAEAGEK